jgi:hypothetical protein
LCLLIFDPLAHVASVILSNTRHTPYCPDILIFSSFFGLLCCSFGIVCGGSASVALIFSGFSLELALFCCYFLFTFHCFGPVICIWDFQVDWVEV